MKAPKKTAEMYRRLRRRTVPRLASIAAARGRKEAIHDTPSVALTTTSRATPARMAWHQNTKDDTSSRIRRYESILLRQVS